MTAPLALLKQRDMTAETTMHTPGPWDLPDSAKPFVSAKSASGSWNGMIASVDAGDYARSYDEGMANARLIAAAPELLTALQSLVDQVLDYEKVNNFSPNPGRKYCWDVTETAIAAIAKAEGRV